MDSESCSDGMKKLRMNQIAMTGGYLGRSIDRSRTGTMWCSGAMTVDSSIKPGTYITR